MKTKQIPTLLQATPTLAVAVAIYASFGLVTLFYHDLPVWFVPVVGGYILAWHSALQHEVVHGHPTRWRCVNEALVYPNLWLWLPFHRYRLSHLRHHRNQYLTDPYNDPESFYLKPEQWFALPPWQQRLLWLHNTSLGRLLTGPGVTLGRFWWSEARYLAHGDRHSWCVWLWHLAPCGLVLAWVIGVCGIGLASYLLLFVYPSLMFTSLRSFVEHQAARDPQQRTALVEAGPLLSLLYLNNNLHQLHHAEPGTAWYRLPARYRARRAYWIASNGAYHYRGYGEVIWRYLWRPKEPPYHPHGASLRCFGDTGQHEAVNPVGVGRAQAVEPLR